MAKKTSKNPPQTTSSGNTLFQNRFLLFFATIFSVLFILFALFEVLFYNRIYPGIYIASIPVSGLTSAQAKDKVYSALKNRLTDPLVFEYKNGQDLQQFQLSPGDLQTNTDDIAHSAFAYGRSRFFLPALNLPVAVVSSQTLDQTLDQISSQVDQLPIDSQIKVEDGEIRVTPSQEGTVLDKQALKQRFLDYLNSGKTSNNTLPVKKAYPKLSYDSALQIKKRLEQIKNRALVLQFKDQSFVLDFPTVLSLIDLQDSTPSLLSANILGQNLNLASLEIGGREWTDSKITLNQPKLNQYLADLAAKIDRPVVEPLFEFDPNAPEKNRVKQFQPPQTGQKLDQSEAAVLITEAVATPNQEEVELPVSEIQPKNKLTNDLGIKQLIGHGESNFEGSIDNRIYNVKLAASRINGVLVAPGDTFSFVKTVGDITAATGYKQAYVIKSGRTVLDDGGGVCQVSTTLFRSVLNSGLPVVARTAHAYRVHYYENGGYPPGIDATVFYPSVDFQFKNDTPGYVLIQSYTQGLNLYVDLYGTSDGRVATVSKPVILSQTPPPPELRQDDPTLPKGTVKQVDWAAWGANVYFTRAVTKSGQTLINETYRSNFRPWQAVYLVGTKEN